MYRPLRSMTFIPPMQPPIPSPVLFKPTLKSPIQLRPKQIKPISAPAVENISKLNTMRRAESLEFEQTRRSAKRPVMSSQQQVRQIGCLNDFESMIFNNFEYKKDKSRLGKFKKDFCQKIRD